ncbi:hypothetical protein OG21DRAFT_1494729 [Imleria badia]|nr:hypothetical protein OG21DRAFT_1494729 [Imleria badia]
MVAVRAVRSNADKATPPSQADSREDVNGTNAKAEKHPYGNDPKGKCKEKAVDTDDDMLHPLVSAIPPRPPPRPPGWGRDPREDFFHQVPPSLGEPHRKRAVFRIWPRDPKGKSLKPLTNKVRGTLSPDGYVWGATLYDLYCVNRAPEVPDATSIMTGSALCEAMEELGELDTAASEIEWSKSEGKPRVVGVADTEVLIRCIDMRKQDEEQDDEGDNDDVKDGDEEGHDEEDEQVSGHGDGARKGSEFVHDGSLS